MTNDFNLRDADKADDAEMPVHPFEDRTLHCTLSFSWRELEEYIDSDPETIRESARVMTKRFEQTYPCVAYVLEKSGFGGGGVSLVFKVMFPHHVDVERVQPKIQRDIDEFRFSIRDGSIGIQ